MCASTGRSMRISFFSSSRPSTGLPSAIARTASPASPTSRTSRQTPTPALGTQHVAGSTHLEVLHRDGHTRAELIVLRDGGQSVIGGLGENLTLRIEEVGVGPLPGPTHAPAQLVQLG